MGKAVYVGLAALAVWGAAANAHAASAVSTGHYFAEAGVGALCSYGAAGAGFALFFYGNGTTSAALRRGASSRC